MCHCQKCFLRMQHCHCCSVNCLKETSCVPCLHPEHTQLNQLHQMQRTDKSTWHRSHNTLHHRIKRHTANLLLTDSGPYCCCCRQSIENQEQLAIAESKWTKDKYSGGMQQEKRPFQRALDQSSLNSVYLCVPSPLFSGSYISDKASSSSSDSASISRLTGSMRPSAKSCDSEGGS